MFSASYELFTLSGDFDVPVGPISTLVPERFHKHISRGVLKSLICEDEKSASKIRAKIGVADIPVIVRPYTENVYDHILRNLTSLGRDAIQEIHPWIINVLVDWANFDNAICSSPVQGLFEFYFNTYLKLSFHLSIHSII